MGEGLPPLAAGCGQALSLYRAALHNPSKNQGRGIAMHPKDKDYGEWVINDPPTDPIIADRILGLHVAHDQSGRPDFVEISWQTAEAEPFQVLQLDYPNALFLLSVLKSMQLDEGTPFPEDPRAPM